MKDRDRSIDVIRGVLMLLVVIGHSVEFLRQDHPLFQFVYNFIYFFHMPVFIFITGYLSKNLEKGRRDAVKNYLVPFLFFNIIWSIITVISNYFIDPRGFNVVSIFVNTFFTPGWALWFILSVFIWKMILPDIVKIKNAFLLCFIIALLSVMFLDIGSFLSLTRTISFLPYFLAGYYASYDWCICQLNNSPRIDRKVDHFNL